MLHKIRSKFTVSGLSRCYHLILVIIVKLVMTNTWAHSGCRRHLHTDGIWSPGSIWNISQVFPSYCRGPPEPGCQRAWSCPVNRTRTEGPTFGRYCRLDQAQLLINIIRQTYLQIYIDMAEVSEFR